MVYRPLTVHAIPDPIGHPSRSHKEEPILQNLPYHAANHGLTLVHRPLQSSGVLPPHESHDPLGLTRSDWQ